jgi:hypothetical protein
MAPSPEQTPPSPTPPPRAFTQGVGTVYQFVGVILLVAAMLICCGSSLFSKNVAERRDLMVVGWTLSLPTGTVFYSAQMAIIVSLLLAVFFGIALAGIGLGLQAENRPAANYAAAVSLFATAFWAVQAVFLWQNLRSIGLTLLAGALCLGFAGLAGLAMTAVREMRRNPPPPGHEILPADYKVPYSHMHQDPPEVRLARDLEQRRERLAVQQKELEMLEARLKRKLDARPPEGE